MSCSEIDCPWTRILGVHEHKQDQHGREYTKKGETQ
jgi:hypothetical protein